MGIKTYLADFVAGYVECALWSSNDLSDESGGNPLDENFGSEDIAEEAMAAIKKECRDFVRYNLRDLAKSGLDAGQAGHDFWLTRNGHGSGFWDRGLGKVGDRLTKASKPYGEYCVYVGDDGHLYFS